MGPAGTSRGQSNGARVRGSGTRGQERQGPESRDRQLETKDQGPESRTKDQGPGTKDQGTKDQGPGTNGARDHGAMGHEPETGGQGSRTMAGPGPTGLMMIVTMMMVRTMMFFIT